MKSLHIQNLQDYKIGHQQNKDALTGCTVVIAEEGAVTGVDVRGGAPGTRETDLLASENTVSKAHAIFLSGGSAYGLDVGGGVMQYLEEKGIGFDTKAAKVPIVPGAILYDLGIGNSAIRPDKKMGYQAAANAYQTVPTFGNVGAGTGASVGKVLGEAFSMKSGIGYAGYQIGPLQVAAIVAVNAVGDIIDPTTGKQIAGVYDRNKQQLLHTSDILLSQLEQKFDDDGYAGNTTIGTIITNAKLTKAQANKIASIAHDGLAKTTSPSHTFMDGDTLFAMASGKVEIDPNIVAVLATSVVAEAIVNGVKSAESVADFPAFQDMNK
ncbi:P1 family peptidase [Gracilibacillus sp. S3-1-1]|uniref:P1 family peptidase n=1 Tax=Gracilibacillus pellucidus TaxID=3095368 RepID=A0ACC6M5G4_9BACI|nr:P1 family peptidase [Gracilibacillus sp. S3-1-1]MDX8046189.1 P1 family peptidase [Gracilibacillus sp. S3-1-1]